MDRQTLFQETLEHPDSFLVESDAGYHQILTLRIARFSGQIASSCCVGQQLLIRGDKLPNVLFLGERRSKLLQCRSLSQLAQAANGIRLKRADALGDLIHSYKQLLVLGLKSGVKGEKAWTFDVPVSEMGKSHERIGIRQNLIEAFGKVAGSFCR